MRRPLFLGCRLQKCTYVAPVGNYLKFADESVINAHGRGSALVTLFAALFVFTRLQTYTNDYKRLTACHFMINTLLLAG